MDHDAVGFLDVARRDIAQPVHPFEAGAIAEMEARDRVGRTFRAARAGQISRAQAQKRAAQRLLSGPRLAPPHHLQRGEQRGFRLLAAGKPVFQPAAEARCSRQGRKAGLLQQLRPEFFDHLLDQEIAERDPAQPVLAVRDGIKKSRCRCAPPVRGRLAPRHHSGIIPQASNFPHWEQPEAFVERLSAFLDKSG
jgi:pimeloyl-ACP methyl ester carboxylesterase